MFLDNVEAKSAQGNLDDNIVLVITQDRSIKLDRKGVYNYSTDIRDNSIGLVSNIQLAPTINLGLGLMLGGIEVEFETQQSMVNYRGSDIDIDSLLGLDTKIKFADIIPYANLGYYVEDHKQRLSFSASAGVKLLMISNISVVLDGEFSDLYEQQHRGVVSRLQQDIIQDLKDYYLGPTIQMNLNYVFN